MSVNPAEGDEIELILDLEDFLLVHCVTGVARSALFRQNDVSHQQLVLLQRSSENSARLDVFQSIGFRHFEELGHCVIGNFHRSESALHE